VKAGNILVTKNADLKVADFGVSQSLSEAILGDIAGSPLWMAPEVCQRKDVNHKADIWSLGITGIELVQGDLPYCELSAMKVMSAIPRNPPPTIADHEKALSKDYHRLISLMLAKNRDERPEISALLKEPCLMNATKSFFSNAVKEVISFNPTDPTTNTYAGDVMSIVEAQALGKQNNNFFNKIVPVDNEADCTGSETGDVYSTTFVNRGTHSDDEHYQGTTVFKNEATIRLEEEDAFSTTVTKSTVTSKNNPYATTITNNGPEETSIIRRKPHEKEPLIQLKNPIDPGHLSDEPQDNACCASCTIF
jgi:serine/threonine protein kinase